MVAPYTNGVPAERGTSRVKHRWPLLMIPYHCRPLKSNTSVSEQPGLLKLASWVKSCSSFNNDNDWISSYVGCISTCTVETNTTRMSTTYFSNTHKKRHLLWAQLINCTDPEHRFYAFHKQLLENPMEAIQTARQFLLIRLSWLFHALPHRPQQ